MTGCLGVKIMCLVERHVYMHIVFREKEIVMVVKDTFYNISVISWRSVLLVEETGVPGENNRPAASHRQTLSHNVVCSTPLLSGIPPMGKITSI